MLFNTKIGKMVFAAFIISIMIIGFGSISSYAVTITDKEPNNTLNDANYIPYNYLDQWVTGNISTTTDEDCFCIYLLGNANTKYIIDFTSSVPNTKLTIYETNQSEVQNGTASVYSFYTDKRYHGQIIHNSGGPLGFTYIKVSNSQNTVGNYSFKISEALQESEAPTRNDTSIYANTIPSDYFGKKIAGVIDSSSDVDYFKFTPKNTGSYIITGVGEGCFHGELGELIDTNFVKLDYNDYNSNQTGASFELIGDLKANQTYYIKMSDKEDLTGNYYLEINPSVLVYDEWENNDSFNTANTLPSSDFAKETKACIGSIGDLDYYKFIPQVSGTYAFEAKSMLNTQAYLYDSNKSLLMYKDGGGVFQNFKIVYNLTAGQTYYLKVDLLNQCVTGDYNIKITPPDPIGSDGANNSFSNALVVSNNSTTSAQLNTWNDVDFYKFTAPTRGCYTIECDSLIDTDGEIYAGNGVDLISSDTESADNFRIELDCTEDNQIFYIKVNSFSESIGSYKLKITKGRILQVPLYTQQPYSVLCGAASTAMILSHYLGDSKNRTRELAVSRYENKGEYPCIFNQVYANGNQMLSAIKKYTGNEEFLYGTPSILEIGLDNLKDLFRRSINSSNPILTKISWKRTGGEHFHVVKGYIENDNGFYIVYNDPWDGKEYTRLLSEYVANDDFSLIYTCIYGNSEKAESVLTFNDSFETATIIPLFNGEGYIYAKAEKVDGPDYFKFTPLTQGTYTIESCDDDFRFNTGRIVQIPGYIYNQNEEQIGYSGAISNYFRVTLTLEANQDYYIKVLPQVIVDNGNEYYAVKVTKN